LEMMADLAGLTKRPVFDSGDTRADMVAVLAYRPKEHTDLRERLIPRFIAYSVTNPRFGHAWRSTALGPPKKDLRHLLALGIEKGELQATLDVDLSLALLIGPVIYWKVFLEKEIAEPRVLAEGVVDVFWRAFATPPSLRQPAEQRGRRQRQQ